MIDSTDVDMNFLVFQALNTISTLPFHLIQDTFRWNMFRGDIPTEQLNDQYWAEKYHIWNIDKDLINLTNCQMNYLEWT